MAKPDVLEQPLTEEQIESELKRRRRKTIVLRSLLALGFIGLGLAGGLPLYGGARELVPVVLLGVGVAGLFLEGVAVMDDMGKGGAPRVRDLKPAKVAEQKRAMDWAEHHEPVKQTLDGILRIRRWVTREEYRAIARWVKTDFRGG
ncbi:hypothetical protein [Thiohalorhabdus methylotrophus]|uniref:Uncharacterized protein n=1 Tax=Thiohalorhabdus methylotrophus TaxID=3242694 RepID=A0ABV4TYY5_9GAMM